ncbi:hypothetical protein DFH08DRAFT_681615, partial [Mycena albidolilacea]
VHSPFADRLNTNYIPSNTLIVEMRALLVDPTDELRTRPRDGNRSPPAQRTAHIARHRSTWTPVEAHKALMSPMRRIPQEVLSCLPTEHNAVIDAAEVPLLLGRICRHWRSVAYTTSVLWTSIHIPCLNYIRAPPNMISGLEGVVEAWLERSATCPLSVSFFDSHNQFELDFENHPFIFQLLPISRRLGHLTLVGHVKHLRPFLRLGPESLPLLKRLWIQPSLNHLFEGDEYHPRSNNALQLAALEGVTLRISSAADPLSLPLSWSQLTRLRLECSAIWTGNSYEGGLDVGGALNVLRRCPNLVRCKLEWPSLQCTQAQRWIQPLSSYPTCIHLFLAVTACNFTSGFRI